MTDNSGNDAGAVGRDIAGETVCGFRVAAYRETHPEHGDKYGHRYSEHWSTPSTRDPRVKVERLFTESQLREALARLTNPAEPSEWQPIESAPKDGSEVMAWGYMHDDGGPYEANGQSLMGEMPDVLIARYESEYGCWIDARGGGSMDGLTHWMPLPAPPLAMTKGGGE